MSSSYSHFLRYSIHSMTTTITTPMITAEKNRCRLMKARKKCAWSWKVLYMKKKILTIMLNNKSWFVCPPSSSRASPPRLRHHTQQLSCWVYFGMLQSVIPYIGYTKHLRQSAESIKIIQVVVSLDCESRIQEIITFFPTSPWMRTHSNIYCLYID